MRIQEHPNKLETNTESQTQDFGIGDASVIIDILRNRLYEHKVRTTCQEYICNARDSHRELGKSNNFEITVPTRLNPVFKVRDFGPGISPERMSTVFIKYGASTKRTSNDQTGGFGIGAKSAWSYTDSFTVVTFIDGVKRSYVAHIGVSNQGRLDLVATDETDEANGTEIQVAVKNLDIEEFRSAIFRATHFWEQKPTLKGELNPPTLTRGEIISDLLEVIDANLLPEYVRTYNQDDMTAVIDGVPYTIGHQLISKVPSLKKLNDLVHQRVVLHFGNGVVEVAASRESIADSKHTVASLEKLGQRALLEAQTHISDAFGKVTATADYLRTYVAMSKVFRVDEFAKYGDYIINSARIKNPLFEKIRITVVHCMGKYGRGKVDKITRDTLSHVRSEIEIDKLPHLFFVTTPENTIVQNKRVREYFKGNNTHLIMLEVLHTHLPTMDAKGQPVLDKENKQVFHPVSYPAEFQKVIGELGAKDFSTITYVDPPKVAKAKVERENTAICLHPVYGARYEYTTLAENTQKWIYVRMTEGGWPVKHPKALLDELEDYTKPIDKTRVCGLGERACKMVEGDPNFISLEEWLKAFKLTKELTLAAKCTIAKNIEHLSILSGLKGIEDKFILEMMDEYKAVLSAKVRNVPSLIASKIADLPEVKTFKEDDGKLIALFKKEYPLIQELQYSNNKSELVYYINGKYEARKSKKS